MNQEHIDKAHLKSILRCLKVERMEFDDNSGNFSEDPFILYQAVQMSKGKLLEHIVEAIIPIFQELDEKHSSHVGKIAEMHQKQLQELEARTIDKIADHFERLGPTHFDTWTGSELAKAIRDLRQ